MALPAVLLGSVLFCSFAWLRAVMRSVVIENFFHFSASPAAVYLESFGRLFPTGRGKREGKTSAKHSLLCPSAPVGI